MNLISMCSIRVLINKVKTLGNLTNITLMNSQTKRELTNLKPEVNLLSKIIRFN